MTLWVYLIWKLMGVKLTILPGVDDEMCTIVVWSTLHIMNTVHPYILWIDQGSHSVAMTPLNSTVGINGRRRWLTFIVLPMNVLPTCQPTNKAGFWCCRYSKTVSLTLGDIARRHMLFHSRIGLGSREAEWTKFKGNEIGRNFFQGSKRSALHKFAAPAECLDGSQAAVSLRLLINSKHKEDNDHLTTTSPRL